MTDRRICHCGKKCLTHDEAHHAARFLNEHQQNDRWPVHAYQCGATWHTGHVPATERQKRSKPAKANRRRSGPRPRPLTPHDQLPPELQ